MALSFQRAARGLLILMLAWSSFIAEGQDKPGTPAEQFQPLLKEFQLASSSGRVLTDEERMQFVGQTYKHRHKLALEFIALAEKYPQDPVALEALMQATWQVNGTPWPAELVGQDSASPKALALLQRDYIQSEKLGPVCQRIAHGFAKEYETFLRAVLEKNPHTEVQGVACLALGHFLNNRQQRLDLIRDQPKLSKEFEDLFGKEYLAQLQQQDRAKTFAETEGLFEQALAKYGDLKTPDNSTVGERAKAELFEMRHLSVGMEAPDIEGVDQDGQSFKLTDYRGKVVLLDFWNEF